MIAAAITTTAITAAPFMGPRPIEAPAIVQRPPASSEGAPAAVFASLTAPAPSPVRLERAASIRRVRPLSSRSVVRTVAVEPAVAITVIPAAAIEPASDVIVAATAPRKPLARKLAGFLTGSGAHTVHPFPTLPTER
jgi:hypothetical protein